MQNLICLVEKKFPLKDSWVDRYHEIKESFLDKDVQEVLELFIKGIHMIWKKVNNKN